MRCNFWRGPAAVAAIALLFAAGSSLAEDAKPKVEKKPPSVCKGLDTAACATHAECSWFKLVTTKTGKTRKAHCQKRPQHFAKKKAAAT